jgi:hypothetical protein
VDVSLLPDSRPRGLAHISHQPPTAFSGLSRNDSLSCLYSPGTDRRENIASSNYSLLRVTQPLPNNDCFSGLTLLVLRKYATIRISLTQISRNFLGTGSRMRVLRILLANVAHVTRVNLPRRGATVAISRRRLFADMKGSDFQDRRKQPGTKISEG